MRLLWHSISQCHQTVWMISINLFALNRTVFQLLLRNFARFSIKIHNLCLQIIFLYLFNISIKCSRFSSIRFHFLSLCVYFVTCEKCLWKQQKYLHWQTFVYFINKIKKNWNGFATACKMSKFRLSGAKKKPVWVQFQHNSKNDLKHN